LDSCEPTELRARSLSGSARRARTSPAKLAREISEGSEVSRAEARARHLELLASGGSDHPMALLKKAGVDLSEPSTIQAVIDQLDKLVGRLEELT
jgi:oligoendopeptidase F